MNNPNQGGQQGGHVLFQTYRMRQRAGVLGKLPRLQVADVANALHRSRAHVGAELLVAVDGQAFLEAQLEPVATGYPVAAPVVKVLVGDDQLDVGGYSDTIEEYVPLECRSEGESDASSLEDSLELAMADVTGSNPKGSAQGERRVKVGLGIRASARRAR